MLLRSSSTRFPPALGRAKSQDVRVRGAATSPEQNWSPPPSPTRSPARTGLSPKTTSTPRQRVRVEPTLTLSATPRSQRAEWGSAAFCAANPYEDL